MLLKAISGSPSLRLAGVGFYQFFSNAVYEFVYWASFPFMSCRLLLESWTIAVFLLFIYLNFVRMKKALDIISDTIVGYCHMLSAKKIYASCSAWNRLKWPLLLTSHPSSDPTSVFLRKSTRTRYYHTHFPLNSTKCRKLNKQPWVSKDG